MILHRLRIYITAAFFLFMCYQSICVPGTFASEALGNYRKWEQSLDIGYVNSKNNYSIENIAAFSLTYNLNGLIETEIDSPFHYVNPGFGFGDTELSGSLSIINESGLLPDMLFESTALIPVEYSNQEAVSQIYELEHLLGLEKQLSFMSIQTNIGYITTYDQISDQGFDHSLIYGLEIEFPLFLEKIICGTDIKGDFAGPNNEYPVFIKTSLVYELNDRIAIDGGFEFDLNDPEIASMIISFALSI